MQEERLCEWCGGKYIAKRHDARFCSKLCSNRWHNYVKTHEGEDFTGKPWMKKAEEEKKRREEPLKERTCEICGIKFMPRNRVNVFCPECRQLLYESKKPEKDEKPKPKRTAREKAIEETKMQAFADLAGVSLGRNYGIIRSYFDRNDFSGLKKIAYKLCPARND